MQAESLRLREADFDKLLSASFDEFQGFPWGSSDAFSVARRESQIMDNSPLPNALDEVRTSSLRISADKEKECCKSLA